MASSRIATVDLNRATREELTELPGIGGALADRIIAHRTRIDGFRSVDDLIHVAGVSERLLVDLEPQLTLAGDEGSRAVPFPLVVVLDRHGDPGSYAGCSVSVTGQRDAGDGLGAVPFAASAPTSDEGTATVTIPPREHLSGPLLVRAHAPDGSQIGTRTVEGPFDALPDTLEVVAKPPVVATTSPNEAPGAGAPTRIRGRVIDRAGGRVPAGLQVVLWGASAPQPGDADFRALIVATTDGLGHFTGPYPLGPFTAAHAGVSVSPSGGPPQTVPVPLEDGRLPESVILVVDLPAVVEDADDDCACHDKDAVPRSPDAADLARADGTFSADAGAGRCVDFTKPDRTLEEFSFSYVVRTTEPDIRGITLEPPRRIDPKRFGDLLDLVGVPPDRLTRGIEAAAAPVLPPISATVLRSLARDPSAFTLHSLSDAVHASVHGDFARLVDSVVARPPGRTRLSADNAVDWDESATEYQACTIAHGHLLHFKQEWVSDGYSMGNLLYSLPLAPGQRKQLAVVDWERRESSSRTEASDASESLEALVDRDRDISEIVTGAVRESTRGGSSSSAGGFAVGGGIAAIGSGIGGLLGIGGGASSAGTSAWQTSSRNTAANALNQLRDRTIQSASSVRSQRTSVVQTVRQGERVSVTTESVANYNHCHALTIQYFEVLRHLLVRQRLVDVQECLFVPLLMSWFSAAKALRWRSTLEPSVPRALRQGFGALDRIAAAYAGSDLPTGRYADESLQTVDGDLRMRFELVRPRDGADGVFDPAAWSPLLKLFGFDAQEFHRQYLRDQAFKDRVFLERVGPRVATRVVSLLKVNALLTDGSVVDLRIDPTLISDFTNDQALYVTLRMAADLPPVRRVDIKAVVISARLDLPGFPFLLDALPSGSRVVVESGSLRYRTAHHVDHLFRDTAIRNDLTRTDDVRIETPLNRAELRNPREEDKEHARLLLAHLNEHIERYHHDLWRKMSPDRRYMLLDGFEAPGSDGRSVASVVENELIGVVGNCLVMPVARGFHLDPTFDQDVEHPIDLLEHYQPNTPIEPSRIALPTPGVYAEGVMGACNSCEQKDETRFWRWEESPLPDAPTAIQPVSTDSRRSEPPDLTAKDFPTPIIAMQSAPAAPDPTGLGAAFALLGQSGLFKDITGIEGTQKNAAAALQGAFDTATAFGTKAADLALQGKMTKDIDKAMESIQKARSAGLIDDKTAGELTQTAIRGLVGAGATNPTSATTTGEVKEITDSAGANKAAVKVTRPTGEAVEVDARETGLEESGDPVILLVGDTSTAQTRAFHPAAGDRSGAISVEARFNRAPAGARLRWSSPEAGALDVATPSSPSTVVRGLLPSRRALDVDLLDAGGTRLASMKLQLSVPQTVVVTENAADFDAALTSLGAAGLKDAILTEARTVVTHLLRTANVRVFWQVGGLSDAVPAHVTAANQVTVTIRNKGAKAGLTGTTFPPQAHDRFDEKIEIYPGAYTDQDPVDLDTETIALVTQLESSLVSDPALEAVATTVYGRLLGATIAHEVVHALIARLADPTGHTQAPANDLMSTGDRRGFRQRTGMENTRQQSPVDPADYTDHGVGDILGIGPATQAALDLHFPVPPTFG